MSSTTIRTYETFEVEWTDTETGLRSTWSNYDQDQAEAMIAYAAENGSGRVGRVIRKTFEVTIRPEVAHLYQPGFADRIA